MAHEKLNFGRRDWLERICGDPGVSALQFRLAFGMSALFSAEGKLKARLLEIAARCGTSVASTRAGLFRLAERGFLTVRIDGHFVHVAVAPALPRRKLKSDQRDAKRDGISL